MNTQQYKEYIELQVLESLAENKTQTTIAQELTMAIGKVNYIANALIGKGFIKAGNFVNAKNKKKYKYLLTEKGLEEKILGPAYNYTNNINTPSEMGGFDSHVEWAQRDPAGYKAEMRKSKGIVIGYSG